MIRIFAKSESFAVYEIGQCCVVNPLPATRKPFFGDARAILLKKSDASRCCYSRYSADDAGRGFAMDDSRRFSQ
jgi:hypothetical protein